MGVEEALTLGAPGEELVEVEGVRLPGAPAVSTADLVAARADGVLTIVELEAMDSLLIGSASFFTQTLHPHGAANQPMNLWVARGELEDGRSFHVQAQAIDELRLETHIAFR